MAPLRHVCQSLCFIWQLCLSVAREHVHMLYIMTGANWPHNLRQCASVPLHWSSVPLVASARFARGNTRGCPQLVWATNMPVGQQAVAQYALKDWCISMMNENKPSKGSHLRGLAQVTPGTHTIFVVSHDTSRHS